MKTLEMEINTNVVYFFNQIYLSLIRELKQKNVEIKSKLKESYRIFDKSSDEYLLFMVPSNEEKVLRLLPEENDILTFDEVLNMHIFKGIQVKDVLEKVVKESDDDKQSFKNYIYLLLVLGYIYYIDDIDDEKKDILLRKTVEIMNMVTKSSIPEDELEKQIDDVLVIGFKI